MPERRPAILLVPGMCSVASAVYEPLITELKSKGFEHVQPINLPSIDAIATKADLKPTALEADIAAIRSVLTELIEKNGHDVLVVAHSYGGTPALCACEALWKRQRGEKDGGVIRACLLSSSLSLPGSSVAGIRAGWAQENPEGGINDTGARIDMVENEMFVIPEGIHQLWFSDFPEQEIEKWGLTLKPAALGTVATLVPQIGVNPTSWNISYLVTIEQDKAMPEAFQRFLIKNAEEAGAHVDNVLGIRSGHFVQISHAEEVADWIFQSSK